MAHGALTLWHLTDGKPGHLNQMLGLTAAIQRRRECNVVTINVTEAPRLSRWFPPRLFTDHPTPDLILCAGRRTHRPALTAQRVKGGRLVVCMRPSTTTDRFDLCLIPRHDQPAAAPNIELTTGALVNVQLSNQHDPARGVILIGGPSKHHGVDEHALLDQIKAIIARDGTTAWDLTTSRRTPPSLAATLTNLDAPNLTVTLAANTPQGWVAQRLASAGSAWITEDSVSMICEALTSGCAVGLLPMPRLRATTRVTLGIDDFLTRNLVTSFTAWTEGTPLSPPTEPLNEADRCAALILDRFFPTAENAP